MALVGVVADRPRTNAMGLGYNIQIKKSPSGEWLYGLWCYDLGLAELSLAGINPAVNSAQDTYMIVVGCDYPAPSRSLFTWGGRYETRPYGARLRVLMNRISSVVHNN